ncbi:uncharacterized protein PSANT_04889 [Moesziomyces antarcticus]|uniref:Beta-xylosidase n=1 Tax=Pseudozyma antarctica TaxID=84753 RepID=A0A5C3FUF6_PSEA2|nr:uncharacterized protein PSANT_04889 [Moesziomyces antarcticus]
MKCLLSLVALATALSSVQASHAAAAHAFLEKRATDTVTVHLDQCRGRPQHYGSGMLYGAQGTNSPPQSYLEKLGINYISAGGAQSPTSGWGSSKAHYDARFLTVVDDWKRMQALNGSFVIKTSDLWGADATQGPNFPFPGDGGNWASYDAFVQQIISDIKQHRMDVSLMTQIELWNEPDLGKVFWGRSQDQYLEMYARGSRAFRKAFGPKSDHHLPLVGPSSASPNPNNDWFKKWLSFVRANKDVQPDIYNWHLEGGGTNDPVSSSQTMRDLIRQYGLDLGLGFQTNEYGTREQQRPGYAAWHHARYEKVKFHGMRGNWAGGPALRDNLAGLLIKNPDGSYAETGEAHVWAIYGGLQGSPCVTEEGHALDSYGIASPAKRTASALVGNTGFTGTANVVLKGISALAKGATHLQAEVQVIPYNHGAPVAAPVRVANQPVSVEQDTASVQINWTNADDAYLVTITAA